MSNIYQELAERNLGEIPEIERIAQRALSSWKQAKLKSYEDAYIDSVALNLHGFYSGLERLFELIARHLDQNLPAGDTWHRDLLQQMTKDMGDTRPAVISQANALALDEFRRFRHLVRNVYTINLSPEKIAVLMAAMPDLWSGLRAELLAFSDFLQALSQASDISH